MPVLTQPCYLRYLTLLGMVLSGFVLAPQHLSADGSGATLKWRNGDELNGTLLGSTSDFLDWKAAPFAKPLKLGLDQLEGIRFSAETKSRDQPPFRLLFSNGDRLDGWLEAITRETITFRALPFADPVVVERRHVSRLVHVGSNFLRYSGPSTLQDWSSSGRDRKVSEWFTDLSGAFATHQWSGNLFREIELPSSVEIRFQASFPQGFPNLEIGLVRSTELGPMLETWDNALVLTYRSQFVPVMELGEKTQRLDFRLFWNQDSGEVLLCDPSGKQLASLNDVFVERRAPDSTKSRTADPLIRGFSIMNRTPELKLLSLTVQEWDGLPPEVVDLEKPRILLAGRKPKFDVRNATLANGSSSLRVGSQSYPLDEFQELILSPDPASDEGAGQPGSTRLAWHDGSNISGSLESVSGKTIVVKSDWSPTAIELSIDELKELRFAESSVPVIDGSDKLEGDGFTLKGAALPLSQESGSSLVGWLPPGATQPVPFISDVKAKITRFPHSSANPELASLIGQARLYLTNDEILVGALISATEEEVRFSSRVTGEISIPARDLRAIDIGSSGRVLDGFGDAEWEEIEELEDEVELTRDTAVIRGGGFGNPSLILGDRIRFSAKWKQTYGALTLRLFTHGGDETAPSTDLIIAAQGNRLFVGKLKESGAFSFSGDQIPMSGDSASFEIKLLGDTVEVVVNDKTSIDIQVDPDRASGNGIYFKMGGGWQGWNQAENEITLTDFKVERTPGSLPRRIIDPLAKDISLRLPRSRRDPIPTHLLIAPNGDLLRGRLISASAEGIRFQSGENPITLPRERVSAIVWLREAVTDESTQDDPGGDQLFSETAPQNPFLVTHQFVLMDGSRLNLNGERLKDDRFVGESSLLGTCSVVIDNVREMKRGPEVPASELDLLIAHAYENWTLEPTPDPVIPGTEKEAASPLIGETAPAFELTMLDESTFDLSDAQGRVVVLDFWATWCGPCIKAIPDVTRVVGSFPEGMVTLCAINQSESLPIINQFLESRDWTNLPVALDFDMKVSRSYLVEGIPHTVVIGKDGKVAWVHTGYSETLKTELFQAIAAELKK